MVIIILWFVLGAVTCLAVSPDTKTIITGSEDKTVATWTYT